MKFIHELCVAASMQNMGKYMYNSQSTNIATAGPIYYVST